MKIPLIDPIVFDVKMKDMDNNNRIEACTMIVVRAGTIIIK